MLILAIETSCDDTAAALLDNDTLISNVLSSQDEIHTPFGGVVPELASRQHLKNIDPVVREALRRGKTDLEKIDLIAVTQGPGLTGSLLVGFSFARAIAHVHSIPLVGVDHMSGHILSVFLNENERQPRFPYISLVVSGGTSSIYIAESFTEFTLLGRTRDDAAGEAFDKIAKLLNLPYPGGPHIAAKALTGNPKSVTFPRAWLGKDSLDFSFSGLKTSVLNYYRRYSEGEIPLNDICAAFQEAVVDVLVEKTILAAGKHGIDTVVLGGGVSCNSRLRRIFGEKCRNEGISFFVPEPIYCTDNAAMIGIAGYHKFRTSGQDGMNEDVYSRSFLY